MKVFYLLYYPRLLFGRFRLGFQSNINIFSFNPHRNRLKNNLADSIN